MVKSFHWVVVVLAAFTFLMMKRDGVGNYLPTRHMDPCIMVKELIIISIVLQFALLMELKLIIVWIMIFWQMTEWLYFGGMMGCLMIIDMPMGYRLAAGLVTQKSFLFFKSTERYFNLAK